MHVPFTTTVTLGHFYCDLYVITQLGQLGLNFHSIHQGRTCFGYVWKKPRHVHLWKAETLVKGHCPEQNQHTSGQHIQMFRAVWRVSSNLGSALDFARLLHSMWINQKQHSYWKWKKKERIVGFLLCNPAEVHWKFIFWITIKTLFIWKKNVL